MADPVTAADIVARAKARCAKHLGPIGYCQLCFRAELEDHLASENPTMKRVDVIQLVDDWILASIEGRRTSPHR